jgi:hypothetical protein
MRYVILVIAVLALFGCADLVGKAVVQTGALNISSAPKGAGIYIDSVYKGVTPKYLSGIPVGSHAVKLKKSGYYDYTATKYVYAGKTTNMYASLKPNTGSINVKSYPSGARIIVDNAYKGATPKTISSVSAGKHLVSLNMSGYMIHYQNVTVYAGQTSYVTANLTKAVPGSLNVVTTPTAASLYVDEIYRGVTPKTVTGLMPGWHSVNVSKAGYYPARSYIYINPGEKAQMTMGLGKR